MQEFIKAVRHLRYCAEHYACFDGWNVLLEAMQKVDFYYQEYEDEIIERYEDHEVSYYVSEIVRGNNNLHQLHQMIGNLNSVITITENDN
jgi:hypothetical protein